MRRVLCHLLSAVFPLIVVVPGGCQHTPTAPQDPASDKGSWTVRTPFDWTHDGIPYQSTYCTIYSDAASDELKRQLAMIADGRFVAILELFDFTDMSDLRYPPGYSRLDIYLNRNHEEGINWAYWGGFIITIRSSELTGRWYNYAVYTVRHELTHAFEFLIEGREELGTDVWFREGIAIHVGCLEDSPYQTVQYLSELESWIAQNQNVAGQGNPIRLHQHTDLPTGASLHEYCRFSELAMRYLLDPKGMGKSFQDVLHVFYDVREGVSFLSSFQNHFGISLSDFENQFYDRMRTYLGASSP